MPAERRQFLGAFALAIFITTCLGWLFRSAGMGFNIWGYAVLLALCALLVQGLARMLRKGRGKGGSVRSIDSYEELE